MSQENIKIAAFTGRIDDPSSYFRLRQHFERLGAMGFDVHDFLHPCKAGCWHRGPLKLIPYAGSFIDSRKFDLIWLSRTLVRCGETLEFLLKQPRVLDVDDAIWLARPMGNITVAHLARHVDVVTAGNSFIAEWFSRYNKNIVIVPTAIDTGRYIVKSELRNKNIFIIGWTGTSSNFVYLDSIAKPLAYFLAKYKNSTLKIIADREWRNPLIEPGRINFVKWSRESEVEELHEMSVGIMPLIDNEWCRGKCSFKMLQYMAVGLPAIVSPVGMNIDVLSKGKVAIAAGSETEWLDAFEFLYRDQSAGTQMGRMGRDVVEQHYGVDKIAEKLAGIFSQFGK